MLPHQVTRAIVNTLDRLLPSRAARHLTTGARGEDEAYFHLRSLGYVMVARNWRSGRRRGEIDLIGWDGSVLCFIEVKTRTTRDVATAEAAVDEEKKRELRFMARDYLRRLQVKPAAIRFDVAAVYLDVQPPEIRLHKDAFPSS